MKMALKNRCPGLIYNSSYDNGDIEPLRVAVLDGCRLTQVDDFNIIMNTIKRSFVITYCDNYGEKVNGEWNGIMGELVNNRSDFSPNPFNINHDSYQILQYSPTFFYGNAITILSGKILANNGNGLSILSSFSLKLWLILFAVFVVIATCNRIFHKEYSMWTWYLLGVVGQFMKLWAVFINQSNQFGNICCVKHLILNSVTLISIFVMTLFFSSEILTNLLIQPLIKIDTMDDLVKFVTLHKDVKLISDNKTSSYRIMRGWEDERAKFILPRITSVPFNKFDYKQVYHGKSIVILFDSILGGILRINQHLNFHLSADRLFGRSYALLFSKFIDTKTKILIDSIIFSLFESGIHEFLYYRRNSIKLDVKEDDPEQTISMSYFKNVMIIYIYCSISLIFIFILELIVQAFWKMIFTWILSMQNIMYS